MPQLAEQRVLAELDGIVPPNSTRVPQPREQVDETGWFWGDEDDHRRSSPTQQIVVGFVLLIVFMMLLMGYIPGRKPQFFSTPAQKLPVVTKYN